MERNELQKLRDLPIEGVAERLGLRVVRHKCLCPFHDDHHASMTFKKNKWKCWSGCGSGDTISLVQKMLGKDFVEACRWLSESWGQVHDSLTCQQNHATCPLDSPPKPFDATKFERYFDRPWLNDEAKKFLFEERRLDPRVISWCRITSWRDKQGIPWLQTPYYDREGRLIGIQNRNLVKGGYPRFRFPQGSQCSIYNLPVLNLLKPGETLFIAEGCSDCWSLLSAGHKAIAIPSATLLSRKDAELLSTLNSTLSTKFAMFPDNDTPGERLFLQLREVLPNLVHHQLPPDCKDFSELYLRARQS